MIVLVIRLALIYATIMISSASSPAAEQLLVIRGQQCHGEWRAVSPDKALGQAYSICIVIDPIARAHFGDLSAASIPGQACAERAIELSKLGDVICSRDQTEQLSINSIELRNIEAQKAKQDSTIAQHYQKQIRLAFLVPLSIALVSTFLMLCNVGRREIVIIRNQVIKSGTASYNAMMTVNVVFIVLLILISVIFYFE